MSKRPFRRIPRSENSLDGEVSLELSRIRIAFRFNPDKVAFIKQIRGSRYEPTSKTWNIPRESYEEFKISKLFPEESFPRLFSEESLTHSLETFQELRTVAICAYQANPFSVASEHLGFLQLDVTFFLAKSSPQLRARVRFGSKAVAVLTRMRGAHFLRSEASFAVPAEHLATLLSKLRDKKLSFAVESNCGELLKSSAELRKRLVLEPDKASPRDLESAFLTPYIDFSEMDGEPSFAVKYATSRHLAEIFPEQQNFHVRKKKSLAFTETELLTVINRVQGLRYPLYITRAVRSHLERRGLHYDEAMASGDLVLSEEVLPFLKIPAAWVVLSEGKAGLLIEAPLSAIPELSGKSFDKVGNKHFYSAPHFQLLNLYNELYDFVKAKETEAFSKALSELNERAKLIKDNTLARQTIDAEIEGASFSDANLVSRLFPHQRVAVKWLTGRSFAMLGDDMGLGKTLSVLATIDILLNTDQISFALVACPNSLTRNWVREVKTFLPDRIFYVLPDAPRERNKLLRQIKSGILPCDALVVNYEKLRRPDVHEALSNLLTGKTSLLCCDESQRIKNARSQTFLAVNELAKLCHRRIALSGTPTPRDITDIWSQVLLLDRGQRFGSNYTKWLKSVAELGTKYSDYAVRKFKPNAVEETISRVHELLLRRRKEDVISLPEKTFATRNCKLNGTQASRYKEVCEQLLLRIGTLDGHNFVKQIDNLLEEYLRAVQLASNPRLVDETWVGEPSKFLELDEIVNEVVRERGEKLIIWTNFLGNVKELVERYKDLGARAFSGEVPTSMRDRTVHEFQNASEIKIIVAVPAAGGVGITLTAAQTAIYLDKSWNAEYWLQSVDRIHRIGQRGTVSIISLSACKVDELISKNLARKSRNQSELLGDINREENTSELLPTKEELLAALREDA